MKLRNKLKDPRKIKSFSAFENRQAMAHIFTDRIAVMFRIGTLPYVTNLFFFIIKEKQTLKILIENSILSPKIDLRVGNYNPLRRYSTNTVQT